jgi:CheY-like chemotaxis protein
MHPVEASALKRVLIVEDDSEIRACLAEVLQYEGYVVSEAPDGGEGLKAAWQNHPDIILLDLMMPRMDGWQFRAAQKGDPELADIPVIVMSAAAGEGWPGLQDVAARFRKPFDIEVLLAAIEEHAMAA